MDDKILETTLLLDFYGYLLTDKQMNIVDMYYNYDLSLGEISEQQGISRQGVYDTLKRAEKILYGYEEKLGLVKRFLMQKKSMKEIIEMIDDILGKNELNEEEIKRKLTDIKEFISGII
ncbi:MAG TPA: putative DNA-binding protein [Bacillota bacterium]|nr:putative DNA-binding protein [Bacillota bacterium]HOR86362.1 putative DNA-binding protein [Bacillota bacterium]HPL53943.1 putative DNA-binding protein [Bacillota bacterium]